MFGENFFFSFLDKQQLDVGDINSRCALCRFAAKMSFVGLFSRYSAFLISHTLTFEEETQINGFNF